MMPSQITEIRFRSDIRAVWAALGGGKLKGNRGQAFWRGGDGYNVALDPERGHWHDFVADEGGDVFTLVERVRGCGFREAAGWLADFAGVTLVEDKSREAPRGNDWQTDLRWATWWGRAAELLAEQALEEMKPGNFDRAFHRAILAAIRRGDASLVAEYRSWRDRHPQLTAAMAHAGRLHEARVRRGLAQWIHGDCKQDVSELIAASLRRSTAPRGKEGRSR